MLIKRLSKPVIVLACIFILLSLISCSKERDIEGKSYEGEEIKKPNNRIQEGSDESISVYQAQDKEGASTTPESKNSPPSIKAVKLMPEVFKPGDTLYIDVESSDPDGDEVTVFYEWYKNGELVSTERHLKSSLKRGDKLVIKMKPFDGKDYGKVIKLEKEILNLPPVITDHKDYHLSRDIFTYQVKATDPDDDTLTYALKTAPHGMTIDQATGLIKWNIPPDFKGKAVVSVSVSDGHGGNALYNFELTIGLDGR